MGELIDGYKQMSALKRLLGLFYCMFMCISPVTFVLEASFSSPISMEAFIDSKIYSSVT